MIFIIGFMGCGKSTVARLAAGKLNLPFADTDELVVRETGLSIAEIFAREGEGSFRRRETAILRRLSAQGQRFVVACGGGIVLRPENRGILRRGLRVFLDTPWAVLYPRIAGDSSRPMASLPEEGLIALWRARLPLYRERAIVIRCGSEAPDMICQRVLSALKRAGVSSL